MNSFISALYRLSIPVILLTIALILRPRVSQIGAEPLTLLQYLPYVLAVISGLLAMQFNRSRFLLLAVVTVAVYWLVQTRLQVSLDDVGAAQVFNTLAFGLPAIILALVLFDERGIFNPYGLIYGVVLCVLAWAAWQYAELVAQYVQQGSPWFVLWPRDGYVLSWAATVLNLLVAAVALVLVFIRRDQCEVALLGTLVAVWALLGWFYLPQASIALFAATGVLQIVALLRASHAMAYQDELTGLLGRRALNERLRGLGGRYALAMVDVDHFKKVNDTHGHDVGDDVLKLVASQLSRSRGGGTCFRYGGEEFCVLFPRRNIEECLDTVEHMREAVAGYEITLRDKSQRPRRSVDGAKRRSSKPRGAVKVSPNNLSVTVSIGLAEKSEELRSPEEVIAAADQKLYSAKKKGRNRVCA
ncbi:GGDEF domain-containing protein [Halieaceae bacterium IMCC14734]|uniref:diguanylate cyclase n=1 Tax=Candidatus Litorirhabdus singularis TaxID=2518993 RepID=A0ABT3TLQ2_9GAMM|nr:GGDEF domain-containing protein [Candidatus Litorirhabdus singularis]MCX2983259.1 GGDEF domain-containing protein [Candidatus Litorirhabdus singularis]